MKYRARKNSFLDDKKAQIFGTFLEKEFIDIPITPIEVVKKATSKSSPIHGFFEWDDRVAATKYRIDQAGEYIAAIMVGAETEDIRAFHHVKVSTSQSGYLPLKTVHGMPDLWQQVLDRALLEAENWSKRYVRYQELTLIHESINQVIKKIKKAA